MYKFAVRGGVTPRSSVDVAKEVLGKNSASLKLSIRKYQLLFKAFLAATSKYVPVITGR